METIYYPDEIAETLCKLAFDFPNENIIKECAEALHDLRAMAENPYNPHYYRTLYKVFESIVNINEYKEVNE